MSEFNIINLNNVSWQLNVALIGGAFSVFSIIYDDQYIYYGLITVAYGVTTHVLLLLSEWIARDKKQRYWVCHTLNILTTIAWLGMGFSLTCLI